MAPGGGSLHAGDGHSERRAGRGSSLHAHALAGRHGEEATGQLHTDAAQEEQTAHETRAGRVLHARCVGERRFPNIQ